MWHEDATQDLKGFDDPSEYVPYHVGRTMLHRHLALDEYFTVRAKEDWWEFHLLFRRQVQPSRALRSLLPLHQQTVTGVEPHGGPVSDLHPTQVAAAGHSVAVQPAAGVLRAHAYRRARCSRGGWQACQAHPLMGLSLQRGPSTTPLPTFTRRLNKFREIRPLDIKERSISGANPIFVRNLDRIGVMILRDR